MPVMGAAIECRKSSGRWSRARVRRVRSRIGRAIGAQEHAHHAGEVTLGGTIEPIHNAVTLAELAVEKGAKALLLPVACRRQLFDLSDEMATKLDIEFYQDGRDALLKSLGD